MRKHPLGSPFSLWIRDCCVENNLSSKTTRKGRKVRIEQLRCGYGTNIALFLWFDSYKDIFITGVRDFLDLYKELTIFPAWYLFEIRNLIEIPIIHFELRKFRIFDDETLLTFVGIECYKHSTLIHMNKLNVGSIWKTNQNFEIQHIQILEFHLCEHITRK